MTPLRELPRALLMFGAVLCGLLLLAYTFTLRSEHSYIYDRNGYVLGVDFVNSWMMGRAALTEQTPGENYDIEHYTGKLRALFGEDYRWQQWSYPPNYVAAMAPFGALPYLLAWSVWLVLSLGILWLAVRAREGQGTATFYATLMLSPAAFIGLMSGQMIFLFTAAQILCFYWMDRKPVRAGVLLGLVSLKPHLGVLYPIFLASTRRWRMAVAAAVVTLLLVALSIAMLGVETWQAFLGNGIDQQYTYVLRNTAPTIIQMMPTLFMDMRELTGSHTLAMGLQIAAAIGVACLLLTPRFRRLAATPQLLVFATASVLLTPYLMAYDLLFFTYALVRYAREYDVNRRGFWVVMLAYWLPFLHFFLGAAGIYGTAFLVPLVIGWVLAQPSSYAR